MRPENFLKTKISVGGTLIRDPRVVICDANDSYIAIGFYADLNKRCDHSRLVNSD